MLTIIFKPRTSVNYMFIITPYIFRTEDSILIKLILQSENEMEKATPFIIASQYKNIKIFSNKFNNGSVELVH